MNDRAPLGRLSEGCRRSALALGLMLTCCATTAANAATYYDHCVSSDDGQDRVAFTNHCGVPITLEYRTSDGGNGVFAPLEPDATFSSPIPWDTNFRFWYCPTFWLDRHSCHLPKLSDH